MSRKGQELISPAMVIVVVLCSEFHVDLLNISTAVFAQGTNTSGLNNQSTTSASDQQSEITIVDKTIVPANKTTVKANVTV
ncbi:MAG: hypothetical protein QN716_08070, partial [Nitrososphaeraceae archaeon]|nr:hypothetical protein [Nitrososphaeraceae archaeon]